MRRELTSIHRLGENEDYGYVPGTPEERIALVWTLTRQACALVPGLDPDAPMRKDVVRISRPKPKPAKEVTPPSSP